MLVTGRSVRLTFRPFAGLGFCERLVCLPRLMLSVCSGPDGAMRCDDVARFGQCTVGQLFAAHADLRVSE